VKAAFTFWLSAPRSSVEYWLTILGSRECAKRGGPVERVPVDEVVLGARARGIHVLATSEALESLTKIDPRKACVVELQYFGGLSVEETAEILGITSVRVKRDWKNAKVWLYRVLTSGQDDINS
jgi:DNA-directed RNA polymerase specialized sigma24 family protein